MTEDSQPNVVRRDTRERGILESRLSAWKASSSALEQLLAAVGVDSSTHTVEIHLHAAPIQDSETFVDQLAKFTAETGEHWVYFVVRSDGDRNALALPVAAPPPPPTSSLALYVEVHSRLIAWWLTYAWRTGQLASATAELASASQTIAAASCARALLETAAAFWVDAGRVAGIWQAAKAAGPPTLDTESVKFRQQFVSLLNELQFGGKFDQRAPELAEVFGRIARTNVLGPVEKLANRLSGDLQSDYQWLCNTVHPSLGTALVFSAAPLVHETRLVTQRWLSGEPLRITSGHAFSEEEFIERSVPSATARCAIAALNVLTQTLDAALRVIDDLGLTTGAPSYADFDYWRMLRPTERNDPCPCRSGKKSKRCIHHWSGPAPEIPNSVAEGPPLPNQQTLGNGQ